MKIIGLIVPTAEEHIDKLPPAVEVKGAENAPKAEAVKEKRATTKKVKK